MRNKKKIITNIQILITLCILIGRSQNIYDSYCARIPFNYLSKCNITCLACGNDRNVCSQCPSYLTLNNNKCQVPANQKLTYSQYLSSTDLKFSESLSIFKYSGGQITSQKVIRICSVNQYKFDVVGLFGNVQTLTFQFSYLYEISQIAINFRLFHRCSRCFLRILLNQRLAYNTTINTEFIMGFSNQTQVVNNTQWTFGNITNNPISFEDRVVTPIRTPLIPLANREAIFKISVQSLQNDTNYNTLNWGISQLSLISKKCTNCVSDRIKQLSLNLGIVISATFVAIVALMLIIHLYQKFKRDKYRQKVKKGFKSIQKQILEQNQKKDVKI